MKLIIDNGRNVPQTIWFGSLALCRPQSKNLPLPNSLCFDMQFSNHPEAYNGQYVLPDSLVGAVVMDNNFFDDEMANVVAGGFDAGIRMSELVANIYDPRIARGPGSISSKLPAQH